MFLVLELELLVSLVAAGLDGFEFGLDLLGDGELVWDVARAGWSEEVGAPDVEARVLLGLLQEEGVVDVRDDTVFVGVFFGLDFFETLRDLFAQGVSLLLLAHFFVDQSHVFVRPLFLRLFRHAQHLAIALSNVLHKAGAVPDQRALNRVHQRACLLIKPVRPASL